ncbi:hypothetical protein CPB83DRAFT_794536 [Crepidotus variabilis]|uniref:N-acetyl-D-glucosamine kinase n=1 Tax=Crepidotus variabilis TaxID=179855 RepID=A0A9P6ECV4_9AGAR|nr:hypothetical protein CPB83DRAFT_794536 [Crepidotus variabilis]
MGTSSSRPLSPLTTTFPMPLYLCVDCGGTKTAAVISDASGNIVGRGSAGPSNITYLSVDGFIAAVKRAVGEALKQATAPKSSSVSLPLTDAAATPLAAAWFGISGADSPAAIMKVEKPLSTLLGIPVGPKLMIANDTHLLASPVRMHSDISYAVAVIAGTGSIAVSFRQDEDSKIIELGRVGGWGWILGDEGGGYDVGRETLRQLLMEQDRASVEGKPVVKGKLVENVLERFGVGEVMEILGGVYQGDPDSNVSVASSDVKALHNMSREKRISSLSPLVFEAGFEHGDPLALRILKTSARNLAEKIALLLGDGQLKDSKNVVNASESVVSFGGSLVGVEKYRQILLDDLAQKGHVFKHVVFVDDAAAAGAVGLAKTYNIV